MKFGLSASLRIVAALVIASLTLVTGAGAASLVSASSGPKYGGSITTTGGTTVILDPGYTGYIQGSNGDTDQIFGSLFLPPNRADGALIPDLATSESFSNHNRTITIDLRQGAHFSDGTALTANAVIWNFDRYSQKASTLNQYFTSVSSMKAKGKFTVVVNFTQPNAVFADDLANTASGYMGSPTAYAADGASVFETSPVGAGPFKISSEVSGQTINLVKNPLYWDAKHVYLASWSLINTSTDATATFDDLESDAIQVDGLATTSTPPSLLYQAASNSNFAKATSPALSYVQMPINTYVAPFNNQLAREALDYCLDRSVISTDVQSGYATPTYVLEGSGGEFLPPGGVAGQEKLEPYKFNPTLGRQIVQQIGGLSFKMITASGQIAVIATAIAQQWAQNCGIQATPTVTTIQSTLIAEGSYQLSISPGGGYANPALITAYQTPTTPQDAYGFNDATVTADIDKTFQTTNTATLAKLWSAIWAREDTLAVDIPVITGGTLYAYSKCLHGLTFAFGPQFTHAYLTCTP